jgi:NTE family protein
MGGVGLVLGAGGVVGQAYHAGVLAMLEHDYGWDPRSADVIVGTSAGAITGALLREGVPATELAAWAVKAPLSAEGQVLRELFGTEIPEFEPLHPLRMLRRLPDPPGWGVVRHAITRPGRFRPMVAGIARLAPGRHDIAAQLGMLRKVEGRAWPERELWICTVRRDDGRRVVFGRPGSPDAPLHLAIAASCALPGYFAPVRIGEHAYVDGGTHSPTNAAVVWERDLDLVIVVSPMSGPAERPTDLYGASRWHAARLCRREVRALRDRGTAVVVFRPGPAEQEVMGTNLLARERVEDVVQRTFLSSGEYAARPDVRGVLAIHGMRF